jgi:hypothetical protein
LKSNYLNVSYSEEDEKILRATELTKDELYKIEELKVRYEKRAFSSCIEDIYVFRKNGYTTSKMAEVYGISSRRMQSILKDIGLNRGRSEAQFLSIKNNPEDKRIKHTTEGNKSDKKIVVRNKEYHEEKERIINSGIPAVIFPDEVVKYELDEKIKLEINEKVKDFKGISNPAPKQYTLEEIFYFIYIMQFILGYTTGEITDCFLTRTHRAVQKWIKGMDWQLEASEVQQRIVDRGKRDYKQIRNKSKESRLKNGIDRYESLQEEYARKKLNYFLPQVFNDCEVIVGLNNTSILDKGNEIDIPIVIIKNDTLYKFAIEYNGTYWHKESERDIQKSKIIKRKGYILFSIVADGKTPNQRANQIDSQIEAFAKEMMEIVR